MSNASKKKEKDKKKQRRAALIAGGVTAAVLALILHPFTAFSAWKLLVTVGVSALAGTVVGIMSTGLDVTTHNREDHEKEFEQLPVTGDEHADEVIAKGAEMLGQIRAANDIIKDRDLSESLYSVENKCVQIFKTIAEKPDKSFQVRKFMNYYLPTTLKMVTGYQTMQDRGVSPGEMSEHRASLLRGLGMVDTACQKQLDTLFKDTILDVSTDVDVLEQMLKRDGFTDGDLSEKGISAAETARTAAAAQLAGTEVPTLGIKAPEQDTTFHSYFEQKTNGK